MTVNTEGLDAHPHRPAARMPIVKGRCPSCGAASLFLAVGGHVTCAIIGCDDPTSADDLLQAAPAIKPKSGDR